MNLSRRSLFAFAALSPLALRAPEVEARPPSSAVELPVGMILEFFGHQPPGDWLVCNGAALSIALYPELFEVIGRSYGGTATTFRLPPGPKEIVADGFGDPASTMQPSLISHLIIKTR